MKRNLRGVNPAGNPCHVCHGSLIASRRDKGLMVQRAVLVLGVELKMPAI